MTNPMPYRIRLQENIMGGTNVIVQEGDALTVPARGARTVAIASYYDRSTARRAIRTGAVLRVLAELEQNSRILDATL